MNGALEITVVGLKHEAALALFFSSLATGEGAEYFHPHPLTAAVAHERAEYKGNDVYAVLTTTSEILGYGILRGWDEGYAVPSLGVAIAGSARGLGLG
ncbi:MAG: N-acetyltransferase, partial [Verrucomicrobia bacterium]|nr:N-acetyltransferase [Verrucomicrobiota bacterium]